MSENSQDMAANPPEVGPTTYAYGETVHPGPCPPSSLTIYPSRRYATLTFLRGSVVALSIALLSGLLGALYYIPAVATVMMKVGLNFTALRPLHTTFAAVFIFLGGVAVVHRYFEDVAGPMGPAERLRVRAQVILWALAGIGIVVSIVAGMGSGREYMGFHPIFSIPILAGWLLFMWNFLGHLGPGLMQRPVHVTMWTVGGFLFMYTFCEQHLWLLPQVFDDPLVDLRIQWKATGTLVGSFNLFVYGSLYYVGCKVSGDERYAHSHLAYALFGVGLINSFTNFGHHTYHLPQNDAVKWIAFVISMTEVILLFRVVMDISAMVRKRGSVRADATEAERREECRPERADAVSLFMTAAKWWTGFILASSIVISIPPLNALIHGTPVVMGHGMGAEIGIDGMALFAAICFLIAEFMRRRGESDAVFWSDSMRRNVIGLNVGTALLVGWLTFAGTIIGVWRYEGKAEPEWITMIYPFMLVFLGLVTAAFLGHLLSMWLRMLFPARRSTSDEPR